MAKNWHPMINKDTCTECGKCVEFCSHGVYDKSSEKTPVVTYPEGCIDQCHGCGGLCPTGSITYKGDNTGWTPPNSRDNQDCGCGCDCSCNDSPIHKESSAKNINIDFL